jgi:hypothetical protein
LIEQFTKGELSASEFCQRAYDALDQLSKEDLLLRKSKGSKQLLEEVLPIATFAKYLERPGRKAFMRCFGGNNPYDGMVYLSGQEVEHGFLQSEYYLEVTTANSPSDYLHREGIARNVPVFGGEKIERVGSKKNGNDIIVSKAIAEDGESAVNKAAEWCIKAINAKIQKEYPSPCILLVGCLPTRCLNPIEWGKVVQEVVNATSPNKFSGVYIIQAWENIVLPAWASSPKAIALNDYSPGNLGCAKVEL